MLQTPEGRSLESSVALYQDIAPATFDSLRFAVQSRQTDLDDL
jgi:hypothetical protein